MGLPNFIPYALENDVLLSPVQSGPKGRNSILQNRAFCLGESPLFLVFGMMGQSNWHITKKGKVKNLGGTSSN
jgi:hypothetical protein